MNQNQRKYLIEKIKQKYNAQIKALEVKKPKHPPVNEYFRNAIASGDFDIVDKEKLRKLLTTGGLVEWDSGRWSNLGQDSIKV